MNFIHFSSISILCSFFMSPSEPTLKLLILLSRSCLSFSYPNQLFLGGEYRFFKISDIASRSCCKPLLAHDSSSSLLEGEWKLITENRKYDKNFGIFLKSQMVIIILEPRHTNIGPVLISD